ncbi:MAG: hypothetical protein M1457_10815 [bacterium]|nr:hypothetical protein [bacterium]
MNRQELKTYLDAQVQEIQKYKWIESEKEHRDIGFNRAALEWIGRYSDDFRHYWFSTHDNGSAGNGITAASRQECLVGCE